MSEREQIAREIASVAFAYQDCWEVLSPHERTCYRRVANYVLAREREARAPLLQQIAAIAEIGRCLHDPFMDAALSDLTAAALAHDRRVREQMRERCMAVANKAAIGQRALREREESGEITARPVRTAPEAIASGIAEKIRALSVDEEEA